MSSRPVFEALYAIIPGSGSVEIVPNPCIEAGEEGIAGFSPGCPPGAKKLPLIVMPGLCNAHIHALDYSIAEIGEEHRLEDLVELPRGLKYRALSRLSKRYLEERMKGLARLLVGRGTLFLGVYAELGDIGAVLLGKVLQEAGVRARLLAQPMDKSYEGYLGLLERFGGIGLDTVFDLEEHDLARLAAIAATSGGHIHVHVSETPDLYQRRDYETALRIRPNAVIHATMLDEDELSRLVEAGIGVVLCPRSNMFHLGLLPRINALPKLVEEGVVALGTDNAAWIPPFIEEEAAFSYIAAHASSRRYARRLAEALVRTITTSCVKLLGLWSKDYEYLGSGAALVFLPEAQWSNDPLVTLVKRAASHRILGVTPSQTAGILRKLLGNSLN